MADVKRTRRQLTIALIIMLVIDTICIVVLVSPIGRGAREGRDQVNQLWKELQAKTAETLPLQGLDSKIVNAKAQIKDFYDERFPDSFAAVPQRLNKLASEHGVILTSAKYTSDETEIPGLRVVRVEAGIDGDYGKEARFINAVERDKTFFLIDNITLGEQQKGGVHLQIVFETYVRSQPAS